MPDSKRSHAVHSQQSLPPDFPYWWCSDYGEDEHGIFMGFKFEGVRQAFRWIPPGTFVMGSPEDEPGRKNGETQYKVTFTQGYWLAETTCTQALWQAVMKVNLSSFRGVDRPVERVSGQQVQEFIESLNKWQPELDLRLPTEAEWEYACRAGTTTPFHFGMTITTDQVNYDGTRKAEGSPQGISRGETVAVKALPANDWGLYQMHGNVQERCSDWYRTIISEPQQDPVPSAPDIGTYLPAGSDLEQVLRGGSWFHDGNDCRSSHRNGIHPGFFTQTVGFRLARGH